MFKSGSPRSSETQVSFRAKENQSLVTWTATIGISILVHYFVMALLSRADHRCYRCCGWLLDRNMFGGNGEIVRGAFGDARENRRGGFAPVLAVMRFIHHDGNTK